MPKSPEKMQEEIAFRKAVFKKPMEEIADPSCPAVKNGTAWEVEFFMHAVRQERTRLGLSLDALSERTGIAKSTLSKLENGRLLNAQVDTLMRIALALGKVVRLELAEPEKPRIKSKLNAAEIEACLAKARIAREKKTAAAGT